jgi:hypothetical protein
VSGHHDDGWGIVVGIYLFEEFQAVPVGKLVIQRDEVVLR